jgi:hypothetical protein
MMMIEILICNTSGTEATENWYSHIHKSACEHKDIKVLWNQGVETDREVLANRTDITRRKNSFTD